MVFLLFKAAALKALQHAHVCQYREFFMMYDKVRYRITFTHLGLKQFTLLSMINCGCQSRFFGLLIACLVLSIVEVLDTVVSHC